MKHFVYVCVYVCVYVGSHVCECIDVLFTPCSIGMCDIEQVWFIT
jgi:hypothetical protein